MTPVTLTAGIIPDFFSARGKVVVTPDHNPAPSQCYPLRAALIVVCILSCFAAFPSAAQTSGTLEGALLVRVAPSNAPAIKDPLTTYGGQLSLFLRREVSLEADVSTGSTNTPLEGGESSVSVTPVSVRAVWMPDPWRGRRVLIAAGYTRYVIAGANPLAPDVDAAALTAGLQQDLGPTRLRLDFDLLVFAQRDVVPNSPRLGGALRLSVGLQSPRACCL